MTGETDDEQGVLNFMVHYNFFVNKVEEADPMETYQHNGTVKG